MSQSKAKYQRLIIDDEVTDGTSYEKHISNKPSIVNWAKAALASLVSAVILLIFIIVIASISHNKEGRYMQYCHGLVFSAAIIR